MRAPDQIDERDGQLTRRTFLKYIGAGSAAAMMPGVDVAAALDKQSHAAPAVPTATGEITPEQMGLTSIHEHIKIASEPALREKSLAYAISDLKRARELGLQTIVDVGPADDVAGIREVSLATGVQVICCTGFYVLTKEQQSFKIGDFEDYMVREIENGIQGTEIRPGVIKVAARRLPITEGERNAFIAAARVQRRYRLPICTHAVSGCAEQQRILEDAGADLKRCYFSHVEATFGWSGRTVDEEIEYLQGVVEKGSTFSFNNFGNWKHTKPHELARIIQELTRRGYDDRMAATMDVAWSFKNGKIELLWEDINEDGKDRAYSYLLRKAVPWMRASGIPERSIQKFILDNPRRIFTPEHKS